MKLTNAHRIAFVNAAMADVPEIDYHEQIQKLATDAAVQLLPEPIQTLWHISSMRDYIASTNIVHRAPHYLWLNVPGTKNQFANLPEDVLTQLDALADKKVEQYRARQILSNKLSAVIKGCTTRKAAAKALPEFEKYLPAEDAPLDRSVPAIANVVADFMNAGWPEERAA